MSIRYLHKNPNAIRIDFLPAKCYDRENAEETENHGSVLLSLPGLRVCVSGSGLLGELLAGGGDGVPAPEPGHGTDV